MSEEKKKAEKEDDPFEIPDVDDAPPPQEFHAPKKILAQKPPEDVQVKSGATSAKPPPLVPPARPAAPPPRAPLPPSTPVAMPENAHVRVEKPSATPSDILKRLGEASNLQVKADVEKKQRPPLPSAAEAAPVEIRRPAEQRPAKPALRPLEGSVEVRKPEESQRPKPALQALEGPVEIVKPVADAARPRPAPTSLASGEFKVVADTHAKTPLSEKLKVARPRKRIGVVDTTFARFNMGDAAEDELRNHPGEYDVIRRTVPGIKDLPVECKILLEEEDCDLVVACGMVGRMPVDKTCAHEASLGIQWAMLQTNRHILEVFVHEDEAKDEAQLARLMDRRTREHAVNAFALVLEPERLRQNAGQGLRQGFDDAGPVALR